MSSPASSTYTLLTNPTTHYYGDNTGSVIIDNPNTWIPYSITVTKSIYDPCPYGYRVPINGSWNGFPNNNWTMYTVNEGIAWQNSWWPASGYRYNSSAVLCNIGERGHCWSASRSPSYARNAYVLYFDYNGNVAPSNGGYRSYGLSVRCIAE